MFRPVHLQCFDAYAPLESVQRCMREGHHVMVLMRGVPGSGKSHLARSLVSSYGGVVYSTDDFFVQNGEYQFQPDKLEEYHKSNLLRVRDAMEDGVKPIIVDNTNIYVSHMEQYILHAVNHFYEIFIVEPDTSWKYNSHECFVRNAHGLEECKIVNMLESLQQQGKPPLSRLIGKGRQIRLEPPSDYVDAVIDQQSNSESSDLQDPKSTNPVPVQVSVEDRSFVGVVSPISIATDTAPSTPITISLAVDPLSHVYAVTTREMSTQTNEVLVTLTCAGIKCLVNDVVVGNFLVTERLKEEKQQRKDRAVRMENIPQVSELDVLVAIFPEEEAVNLSHYYQMLGLDQCVKLFVEVGAYVDWNATVVEGAFVEEIAAAEMSATCPHVPPPINNWQRCAEQEDMKDKPSITSYAHIESAGPVANEITVTLGIDMLQKMSILFGDGVAVRQECSLRVPLWILEQLYLIWRGDASKVDHERDAQLAAFLQQKEDSESDTASGPINKKMTTAQKLQLNKLLEEFSTCDNFSVQQIYEDNKYDATATRATLHYMLNPDIEHIEELRSPETRKVPCAPSSRFEPCPEVDLSLAQEQALQCQQRADRYAEKRLIEIQKARRYIHNGMHAAAVVYQQVAREHAARERSLRGQATELIKKAHENSPFLDLHLLSQKDALGLLKERLAILDRPEGLRNSRSHRRLRVITGYGKSSGGRAVIKPAVESFLKSKGYFYSFANLGEIVIWCK